MQFCADVKSMEGCRALLCGKEMTYKDNAKKGVGFFKYMVQSKKENQHS